MKPIIAVYLLLRKNCYCGFVALLRVLFSRFRDLWKLCALPKLQDAAGP